MLGVRPVEMLFILPFFLAIWVLPVIAGVWALVTLSRIRKAVEKLQRSVDEISHPGGMIST